jgi:hypothetical protein
MDEGDLGSRRSSPGFFVNQSYSLFFQFFQGFKVPNAFLLLPYALCLIP